MLPNACLVVRPLTEELVTTMVGYFFCNRLDTKETHPSCAETPAPAQIESPKKVIFMLFLLMALLFLFH
jgi:hypothetical protein